MIYCKKCGAVVPERALFCPKCGVEDPLSRAQNNEENEALEQAIQPAEQENTNLPQSAQQPESVNSGKEKKPLGITAWVKENFMPLFVILGVVSIVLLQFSTIIALSAFVFAVTLGVFAILCALAFCAVGAIRFFTADVAANDNKHSTGDIICFALGIIGFVYVLVTSIVVLVNVKDILDTMEAMEVFIEALITAMQ